MISVIVKTGCGTDGVLHSTNQDGPRPAAGDREPAGGSRAGAARGVPGAGPARHLQLPQLRHHQQVVRQGRVRQPSRGLRPYARQYQGGFSSRYYKYCYQIIKYFHQIIKYFYQIIKYFYQNIKYFYQKIKYFYQIIK